MCIVLFYIHICPFILIVFVLVQLLWWPNLPSGMNKIIHLYLSKVTLIEYLVVYISCAKKKWERCLPKRCTKSCNRSNLLSSFFTFVPISAPPFSLSSLISSLPSGLWPPSSEWHEDGICSKPIPPAWPLHTATLCWQPNHLLKGTKCCLRQLFPIL